MFRRDLLALTALAGLGLALLPITSFADEKSDLEGVKAASKAFYSALAVFDDGEAMGKVFAQTPYITYVGPRDKAITVGWDAVKKNIASTSNLFLERNVSLTDAKIRVNGAVAWELGQETGETKMKTGVVTKTDWLATNIYENQPDGRWLMVSHHVQQKPQ